MDECKNMQCPFRINESGNVYHCDCAGCENKYTTDYIATNRTVSNEELKKMCGRQERRQNENGMERLV